MKKHERMMFIHDRAKEGFTVFFLFYIFLLFLDFALPGFASFFLNVHWFLILAGLFAIVTAETTSEKQSGEARRKGLFLGALLALGVSVGTMALLQPFEHTVLVSVSAGLACFLLFLLYYFQKNV